MTFSIYNINKSDVLSPSPNVVSVSQIDYSETQSVIFSNLFRSQVLNISNVPMGSNPTLQFPEDTLLELLFSNPGVGSIIYCIL